MDKGSEVVFPINFDHVHNELLQIFFECEVRGLVHSCKWLSDLLSALELNTKSISFSSFDIYRTIPPQNFSTFLFAKSLFNNREYDHCAETLKQLFYPNSIKTLKNSVTNRDHLLYFSYIYARYMACEKRKANDEVELRRVLDQDGCGKLSWVSTVRYNKELLAMKNQIEAYTSEFNNDEVQDGCSKYDKAFIYYVHALICNKLGIKDNAVSLLVDSINCEPSMWPAWFELTTLIDDKEKMTNLNLPSVSQSWMRYFFESKVFLKLHEGERALEILLGLSNSGFQGSQNLQAEIGLAHDVSRAMELSKIQFKQLFAKAPCRLDNVDTFSNVLFVCEDSIELAYLAHRCINLDKYRPETCCVVGNFFSLRGQHEKAVVYFQRALKLKPTYSLVWTLIGHEYMELRNTNAAVHAYRQALVHNRHDFRAWYGLGQMYEMLDLPSFALYYYQEAQYLMPSDSRLIVALGEIYEKLNRLDEAKKCYWRAYCVGDIEGGALVRLASCFEQTGQCAESAAAYTEFIKLCQRNGVHNQVDLAQAYKYLANFHLNEGHFEDAALAANKCLEFPETQEEAKAMFRQITMLAGQIEVLSTDLPNSFDGDSHDVDTKVSINIDFKEDSMIHIKGSFPQLHESNIISPKPQCSEHQPLDLTLDHLLITSSKRTLECNNHSKPQQSQEYKPSPLLFSYDQPTATGTPAISNTFSTNQVNIFYSSGTLELQTSTNELHCQTPISNSQFTQPQLIDQSVNLEEEERFENNETSIAHN